MSEFNFPIPTRIFHITHIDNLRNIIAADELSSKNKLDKNSNRYRNIAYLDVQNKRKNIMVTIAKGGNLHNYVPFHFAPRSPMLYAIHHDKIPEYSGGQENICYLVTNIQKIYFAKLDYVFTNGHPLMQPREFFSSTKDLNQIDWEIFFDPQSPDGYAKFWHDTSIAPDRKRRRQAEFLVYQQLKWEFIDEIGIINKEKATEIEAILNELGAKTPITVKSEWYF